MAATDEAIILAGGLGTRLRSVISDVPKPLAPVAGRPFLAWLLDRLSVQGMRRIVLATSYLGEQVLDAIGHTWHGMTIEYSREQQPLGTGGAILQAAASIHGESFFAINGDTWLELDYRAFDAGAAGHRLGIALAGVEDVARYGAVQVEGSQVRGFVEKGRHGAGLINAGVYRIERALLHGLPAGAAFSFEADVMRPAVAAGGVAAWTATNGFVDIGVPEDYRRAQDTFGAMEMPG